MNKEEAIEFLTEDLRGRFLQYIEKCYAHYQNLDTYLSLSKSPDELQMLEKCLEAVEDGVNRASEIRDFFISLVNFNVSISQEVAPIINLIDTWELSFTSLDHVQKLHRRNLDFFITCLDAGVTESEYDQLFRSTKMMNLMNSTKNTISKLMEMVSFNSFTQLCYER